MTRSQRPVMVRVSVASLWQRFHPCDPDFIADVCRAKCCDAPTRPGGTLISIHRSEKAAIEARGGTVRKGLLVTDGRCTFKDEACLCTLHTTPDKPFGCIASPFTLNDHDTLIVRNRYRMLPCYGVDGARPAYVAHSASLVRIFGEIEANYLTADLDTYGDPKADGYLGPKSWVAYMPADTYRMLRDNDHTKKVLAASSG